MSNYGYAATSKTIGVLMRVSLVLIFCGLATTFAFSQASVTITDTTTNGGVIYAGDTFILNITGGAPNATVTCSQGSWSGNMGTTDAGGNYTLTGFASADEAGQYIQIWSVNGLPASPNPLIFNIINSPPPPPPSTPTVSLTNISRPGSSGFYPGDSFVLNITGGDSKCTGTMHPRQLERNYGNDRRKW